MSVAVAPRQATYLDASMDAVITVDESGCIVGWNPAAHRMFGFRADEILGRELADTIIPPELREGHRRGFAQLSASRSAQLPGARMETTGLRSDGSRFPVELTVTAIREPSGIVFVGFLRDITEQRRLIDALQSSRERLMTVSDEARRRVERDLHDGAQQQLVALAITLGLARQQLDLDSASARRTLDSASELLGSAIDELRELARGIHAEVLVERGLPAALTHLVRRSPIDVVTDVRVDARLPLVVETSVYYFLTEALTNATRYGATRVEVALHLERTGPSAGTLTCSITDDGPGGADPSRGTGLSGICERIFSLDGTVEIVSPQGGGTSLRLSVPALDHRASTIAG